VFLFVCGVGKTSTTRLMSGILGSATRRDGISSWQIKDRKLAASNWIRIVV